MKDSRVKDNRAGSWLASSLVSKHVFNSVVVTAPLIELIEAINHTCAGDGKVRF